MVSDDKIERLKKLREESKKGGGEKRIQKQHEKGKLTARERIDLLLDKNSFEEIDAFVTHRSSAFGLEKQLIPGDGVVTGYGKKRGGRFICSARISPSLEAPCQKLMRKRSAKSWTLQ